MARYLNRADAGRQVARSLAGYREIVDGLVLALPRGGIPVGAEVARILGLPIDVFVVRKLGVPGQEELAMGAIATGGVRVLNDEVIHQLGILPEEVESVTGRERAELVRREALYRQGRPPLDVKGKTVILVDDGLATGASMYAAVLALRAQAPARIVAAVPVAAPETCEAFRRFVDEMVCTFTPEPFYGVGTWFEDFSQVSDEEVRRLLSQSRAS